MLRRVLILIAALSSLASAHAEPIFNGQTLDGWYSYLVDTKYSDPRFVFTVTNRSIRISGDGLGYLATKAQFTNYHLSLEFKWGISNHSLGRPHRQSPRFRSLPPRHRPRWEQR